MTDKNNTLVLNQSSLTLPVIDLVAGEIDLPGSKSITNRALLLAAIAHGTTRLTNLLNSDDTRHMLNALIKLGVKIRLSADGTTCEVEGGHLTVNDDLTLFLGNAGTVMRPLTAMLSLSNNRIVLTGDARMKERPIGPLVEALSQGGAQIDYLEQTGYPPLQLNGGFIGGEIELDGRISSQFLTALLMAAPLARHSTQIHIRGELVSKPYVDMTLHMMRSFGIEVTQTQYRLFQISGQQQYRAVHNYLVEGDASSASYFLAAAAIKGGKVRVKGVGRESVQGDIQFAHFLQQMGAKITWGDNYIECDRAELQGIDRDMNAIPDAAMTVAMVALFAKGETVIRHIANWRVKETDRLAAMTTELRKVGAKVEQGVDFIRILPPQQFQYAEIDTYYDHRIAMCFSLVALSGTPVTIINPGCTAKTFPDYFQQFASLVRSV